MINEQNASRRKFIKKAAYATPAIVSLAVAPSYAKTGSSKPIAKPEPSTRLPPGKAEVARAKAVAAEAKAKAEAAAARAKAAAEQAKAKAQAQAKAARAGLKS